MKVNYDKISDALYLHLKKGVVKETLKMSDILFVDSDKKGNILGIEILNASSQFKSKNKNKFEKSIIDGIPVEILSA